MVISVCDIFIIQRGHDIKSIIGKESQGRRLYSKTAIWRGIYNSLIGFRVCTLASGTDILLHYPHVVIRSEDKLIITNDLISAIVPVINNIEPNSGLKRYAAKSYLFIIIHKSFSIIGLSAIASGSVVSGNLSLNHILSTFQVLYFRKPNVTQSDSRLGGQLTYGVNRITISCRRSWGICLE